MMIMEENKFIWISITETHNPPTFVESIKDYLLYYLPQFNIIFQSRIVKQFDTR